jgi:Xaa-Pro aminopeptidase
MTASDETRPAGDSKRGAAHDTTPPPNFIAFMMKNWEAVERAPVPPFKHAASTRERRERLSKRFPGDVLVVASGHLKVRSNDEYYPFRACSDFFYLTGNQEPDCVLVMVPEQQGHHAVLFVEPNPGKTDSSFFTDRVKGEFWEGARLGVPESAARYQIQDTRPLGELRSFVQEVIRPMPRVRILRGHSSQLEAWIDRDSEAQRQLDSEFATHLSELRLVKDEGEISELRAVIDSTKRGFEDVIRRLKTAQNERELEGVFFTRARMEGNGTGYNLIVAAGSHACTLHWRKNDGSVRAGDLLLLDAGVEGRSLYTADITRTLPINGRFSPEQREIYNLVLKAQRAALEAVRPGIDFMEPNRIAMRVLAHGLEQLGILTMSVEEALREENQFYRRYSLHNISHMLGLDVHDCAKARAEVYKYGPLTAGMVLTIEPGLYFQTDDRTVPAKYRGIGVRIEDNVLVTPSGHENLSAHIPTAVADVERWMAELWAAP